MIHYSNDHGDVLMMLILLEGFLVELAHEGFTVGIRFLERLRTTGQKLFRFQQALHGGQVRHQLTISTIIVCFLVVV